MAGCISELDGPQANLQGSFSLGLFADSLAVEVETRAGRDLTAAERTAFTVTLEQDDETIWNDLRFSDITLADRTQPVGTGYVVSAHSCTVTEAETANGGWGQRRYWGQSAAFSIAKDQNTEVSVECHMANAGLCVVFDDSFTSYFTQGYSVTTDDSRILRFDETTTGRVAYYNVPVAATHTVHLLINAAAGWDGTLHMERDLTLQAGRIYRLYIRKGIPETGTLGVSVTYDDSFDEGTTEEMELN